MALEKQRTSNNIQVSYWKISGINISYTGNIAQIFIIGFTDQIQRQSGIENKIAFENYIVKGEDFQKYFALAELDVQGANLISKAYEYLKEKEEIFINSVDV